MGAMALRLALVAPGTAGVLDDISNYLTGQLKTTADVAANYGRKELFGPNASAPQTSGVVFPGGFGFFTDPRTGNTDWAKVALVAGGGLVALLLVMKLVKGRAKA